MMRHVVLLTWQDGTTQEQEDAVSTALATLPPLMRGLRGYSFGSDERLAEGNAGFAIVADFDDRDAYLAYRDHPVHQEVMKTAIRPILKSRMAAQFEF
jgi:Stress responsive A/B Barrel Domain